MAKRTIYLKLTEYDHYLKEYQRLSYDFTTSTTRYSATLKTENSTLIFNESGESDPYLLQLINKVKNDARKYALKNAVQKIDFISWYRLNPFYLQGGNRMGELYKVDLNEAYWRRACELDIISLDTQLYLDSLGLEKKERKKFRLKSLGSLATRKFTAEYKDGEFVKNNGKEGAVDEVLRPLYIKICHDIDKVMKEVLIHTGGIYYYWDCIFLEDYKDVTYAVSEFKKHGFASHFDKNKFEIETGVINYLQTTDEDGKQIKYPIDV